MILALITIGLIVGSAFLLRNAKSKSSIGNYFLVLIAGIVTLLFEPVTIVLLTDGAGDGGAIQIVSTFFGIFCIGWAIVKMVKRSGNKKTA